ncbi:MAG: hypothetical protein QOK00_1102 [Thermoleophilaceae bacterium]|jgi:2-keto-4-pentenoate hydratase/2-oxohepta-3-ene-1,7-dioic acid hydratase in catechol pathway|nr:hypothetical protein [Thermoleophilaceae bacterium]MEA2400699.1 hypothetical protein [Thermoleophilaceae bacterium]
MRLVTYESAHSSRAGVLVDSVVLDAAEVAGEAGMAVDGAKAAWGSTKAILELGPEALRALEVAASAAAERGEGRPASTLELRPPVTDPDKIICVGLNYRAHADEFGEGVPESPNLFTKFRTSLVGPSASIVVPTAAKAVDYEGELAVVIGARCKNVSPDRALEHVVGCMVFNDVTARDLQLRTSQWTAGKAIDTFAPCGPALVTIDEVGDLQQLRLQTRVNGETVQDATTASMIYPITAIVSFVSQLMTLVPGDIIATGTPEGVGFRRDPPIYLQPGDVVEVEIEGVGSIANPVTRDSTASTEASVSHAQGGSPDPLL